MNTTERTAREWGRILKSYHGPSHIRSVLELVITAASFMLLWFSMWLALSLGYWLSLIMAVPASGFLVRLFMIQHDCGHGAFFRHRTANDWLGRVIGAVTLTVGVQPFLLVHLPITLLAASIGVWLFYVQHQFENTYWAKAPAWSIHEAALNGSSHYELPSILRWFTANIGVHHVHHLCSRIPFYRLQRVLRDHPELNVVGRLTFVQSLGCVRLVLWDEERRRLISSRELRR